MLNIVALLGIGAGAALGGQYLWQMRQSQATVKDIAVAHSRQGEQGMINPLLDCDIDVSAFPALLPLEKEIREAIQRHTDDHTLDHASVYFRSLNGGHWVGVNENDTYIGASLLKLPVAMAYFRQADQHPETLKDQVPYDGSDGDASTQNISPDEQLQIGQSYEVDDLIDRMLVFSDNASLGLLSKHIDNKRIEDVFTDLGLDVQLDAAHNILMSPKDYSTFFRVLYNATYFSREASLKLLESLSQVSYKRGLMGGVPPEVKVAHKFGERTVTGLDGKISLAELHDCGIVYLPDHPYFVCIMTQGKSLDDQRDAITDISEIVYHYMDGFWKRQTP